MTFKDYIREQESLKEGIIDSIVKYFKKRKEVKIISAIGKTLKNVPSAKELFISVAKPMGKEVAKQKDNHNRLLWVLTKGNEQRITPDKELAKYSREEIKAALDKMYQIFRNEFGGKDFSQ